MKHLVVALMMSLSAAAAHAGSCVMTVDRAACPGKEDAALKPYAGKNPTEESKDVASAEECEKAAAKLAKIVRKGTLSKKAVSAKFDGKAVTGKTEEAACK